MTLIIIICLLILIAYAFDINSKHTKVPTVIVLIAIGWGLNNLVDFFKIEVINLNPILPIIGTIGLILIVLEGSLELEINKKKKKIISISVLSAIISLLILFFIFAFIINAVTGETMMKCFINAIPFCIISSAIAIPSAQNISASKKEFVIYESSISDIFGVILFNFFLANEIIKLNSFINFFWQLLLILAVSFISSMMLAYFIKKIKNHVKLIPIMVMVILIYAVAKELHLPSLLFILIFGLFLNNLDEIKHISIINKLEPKLLNLEVHRFSKLSAEAAFLVRTIFFILFGYTIDNPTLINQETIPLAIGAVILILILRYIQLKIAKMEIFPLLFLAPRGLITVMLFLSIPMAKEIKLINQSLIIQVIVLGAFVMMFGLMFTKQKEIKVDESEN
jgi:Kef-type K+ transport system membrane component KefB